MTRAFDAERFRALTRGLTLGEPLVTTRETGSTNDDALAAARTGAPHGALWVTDEQRAGRGRRGNTWLAAPGAGLLFSIVIRPNVALEQAPALALLAGLAVRSAVDERLRAAGADQAVLVKWPNDILVGGKKLAGILVESQIRGLELGAVVVGVGLNVGRMSLPSELENVATSLDTLGVTSSREELLASVLAALEGRLAALESPEMPLLAVTAELGRYDALKGRNIAVGELVGVGAGIDAKGHLALLDGSGVTHRVGAGHVVFRDARADQADQADQDGPSSRKRLGAEGEKD